MELAAAANLEEMREFLIKPLVQVAAEVVWAAEEEMLLATPAMWAEEGAAVLDLAEAGALTAQMALPVEPSLPVQIQGEMAITEELAETMAVAEAPAKTPSLVEKEAEAEALMPTMEAIPMEGLEVLEAEAAWTITEGAVITAEAARPITEGMLAMAEAEAGEAISIIMGKEAMLFTLAGAGAGGITRQTAASAAAMADLPVVGAALVSAERFIFTAGPQLAISLSKKG
jgi:hypothetical protein